MASVFFPDGFTGAVDATATGTAALGAAAYVVRAAGGLGLTGAVAVLEPFVGRFKGAEGASFSGPECGGRGGATPVRRVAEDGRTGSPRFVPEAGAVRAAVATEKSTTGARMAGLFATVARKSRGSSERICNRSTMKSVEKLTARDPERLPHEPQTHFRSQRPRRWAIPWNAPESRQGCHQTITHTNNAECTSTLLMSSADACIQEDHSLPRLSKQHVSPQLNVRAH